MRDIVTKNLSKFFLSLKIQSDILVQGTAYLISVRSSFSSKQSKKVDRISERFVFSQLALQLSLRRADGRHRSSLLSPLFLPFSMNPIRLRFQVERFEQRKLILFLCDRDDNHRCHHTRRQSFRCRWQDRNDDSVETLIPLAK